MHHHTEKGSSLFSLLSSLFSLLSSLFYSLVFFSFVSSSLNVPLSLCLSLCGVVVVLLWWFVVWCVVCVVCDTLKTPCMPAPRAHVFSTCARGANIHGDVLNVFFIGKTSDFF